MNEHPPKPAPEEGEINPELLEKFFVVAEAKSKGVKKLQEAIQVLTKEEYERYLELEKAGFEFKKKAADSQDTDLTPVEKIEEPETKEQIDPETRLQTYVKERMERAMSAPTTKEEQQGFILRAETLLQQYIVKRNKLEEELKRQQASMSTFLQSAESLRTEPSIEALLERASKLNTERQGKKERLDELKKHFTEASKKVDVFTQGVFHPLTRIASDYEKYDAESENYAQAISELSAAKNALPALEKEEKDSKQQNEEGTENKPVPDQEESPSSLDPEVILQRLIEQNRQGVQQRKQRQKPINNNTLSTEDKEQKDPFITKRQTTTHSSVIKVDLRQNSTSPQPRPLDPNKWQNVIPIAKQKLAALDRWTTRTDERIGRFFRTKWNGWFKK